VTHTKTLTSQNDDMYRQLPTSTTLQIRMFTRARRDGVYRLRDRCNASPRLLSFFFFSSRRRHTRSVSAFLLNRSSDLPVKAAELFAFTLRVRAGNTDVLTDAEENVRQKLRAEGVM